MEPALIKTGGDSKGISINTMSIDELVMKELRSLPREKQQEIFDFVDFLESKFSSSHSLRSLKGLWAGRIIAVATLYLNVPLVTRDSQIQSARIKTIW